MLTRVQSPDLGVTKGKERLLPLPSNPRTGGSHILSDYSFNNYDVFSLASILNFSDSWFEVWSGEDLGVWGQSHIPLILYPEYTEYEYHAFLGLGEIRF